MPACELAKALGGGPLPEASLVKRLVSRCSLGGGQWPRRESVQGKRSCLDHRRCRPARAAAPPELALNLKGVTEIGRRTNCPPRGWAAQGWGCNGDGGKMVEAIGLRSGRGVETAALD